MIADVVSLGARGPLGLSSTQVAMCLRARKLEPRSVKIRDRRDQEIGIALTGGLGERLFGYQRMVSLGAPALVEAVSGLSAALAPSAARPLPVILCLPEPGRPDDGARFAEQLLDDLGGRSGVPLDRERSALVRHGQAGFATAIQAAKALLDGGASVVGVGGIDSYYHPEVLRWLDQSYRLHAIGAEEGFIPSEAAAFVMLARNAPSAPRRGEILAAETAAELTAGSDDEPNLAEAMTELLARVQGQLGASVSWSVSDINGERHRYREWSRARERALPRECVDLHWVWDTGDVGAATGALFATIALRLCELGCAPAQRALVALHSEGVERAVVVLQGARP
jgi:3-oxoacyl-[acyl-carrier-protein] synthase-1